MAFRFTDYVTSKTVKEEKVEESLVSIITQNVIPKEVSKKEPDEVIPPTPIIEKVEEIDEKKEFEEMQLTDIELLEIKKLALKDIIETDLNVSELIDLVLLSKSGKPVKQKNSENLMLREYIDYSGKITKNGRMYLEFDEVKQRLRNLIK